METQNDQNKKYWKSLDEKYQTPEFLEQAEKEFQSSPLKEEDDKSGMARRQFMKLMGASVALSSAACVRRPVQKIIPYNKRPADVVIGIPNYYATSIFDGREGFGVNIKTREGRPLFVAGNPSYPGNATGVSVRGSSQLLNLYDPDRVRTPTINSQDPMKRGNKLSVPRDWESLDKRVVEQMAKGGVRILSGDTASPSLKSIMKKFAANTGAKLHFWSPINQGEVLDASKESYGVASIPKYRYDEAKMIVSIDADFLGTYLNPIESSKLFTMGRNPDKKMSRLVSFQSVTSLTSMNADDNHSIKASQQLPLVLAMIHELGVVQKKVSISAKAKSLSAPFAMLHEKLGMSHEDFAQVVSDLWANQGMSIVVAGGLQAKTKDAFSLQIAVNYLNSLLGNDGSTIHWANGLVGQGGQDDEITSLMADIEKGDVKTLIINELNPMYNLPNSSAFRKALGKVKLVVATNNWMDETASLADLVAPAGHYMENWGDSEFEQGLMTIQQPTIRPLYNTRSFGDSLITWSIAMKQPVTVEETFYAYVKTNWMKKLGSEKAWIDLLQKGFSGESFSGMERSLGFNPAALNKVAVTVPESDIELSLYSKVAIHDGTMANVSWLQELPDPVSKIVWDNYLMISPSLADEKGLRD